MVASLPQLQLIDGQQRRIRKLRLSLTDRCNLRCTYCIPTDATFMSPQHYLTAAEYAKIVAELVALGVESVRLTGGEPLLRREFPEILAALVAVGVPDLSLTTNGVRLSQYLDLLATYGVRRLNISLDSLNPQTFAMISHGSQLEAVKGAIACHRYGSLQLGEIAVWVGTTAPHRRQAFAGAAYIIDEIKHRLPIWKKEYYVTAPAAWVYCREHIHE